MKDPMSENIGYGFDMEKLGRAMLEHDEIEEFDFRQDCPLCANGQIKNKVCDLCGEEIEFIDEGEL